MMRFAILCVLMVATSAAQAQRVSKVDGNRLGAMCAGKATGECDAYLSGVADAIEAEGHEKAPACIPVAVTGVQLREVVAKYLRGHPENRQMKAGALTIKAFSAAFPCHP